MTINQIRYFVEICKYMNFTKAADSLYIAQSTLSRQMQLMETELKVKLINRNYRHMELTAAGTIFYEKCTQLIKYYDDAIEEIHESIEGKKIIKIGIYRHISADCIFDFLGKLYSFFPEYELIFSRYEVHSLQEAYERGKIHMAISLEPICTPLSNSNRHIIKQIKTCIIYKQGMFPADYQVTLNDFEGKVLTSFNLKNDTLLHKQSEFLRKNGLKNFSVLKVDDLFNSIAYEKNPSRFAFTFINNELLAVKQLSFLKIDVPFYQICASWNCKNNPFFKDFFQYYYRSHGFAIGRRRY